MKNIFLDGNIYDQLAIDEAGRGNITKLIKSGALQIIATPVIRNELSASPYKGIPNWFPVLQRPEAVAIVGEFAVGEAILDDGEVYTKHRGESTKVRDGIIAQSAHTFTDIFVTNDKRCRKRFQQIKGNCIAMDYAGFLMWLKSEV